MNFDEKLNGHAIGIVMKELVRRAISTIRSERIAFEVQVKQGYGGNMDDVLTSADKKAQDVYVKSLRECFPSFGIVSEEGVEVAGDPYFTIDPLDGTKAFVRGQSHGVGTMIALVSKGDVLGAFIGDVNTGEIYGYRPGSNNVHRMTDLDLSQKLDGSPEMAPGTKNYLLMRDPPDLSSRVVSGIVKAHDNYLVDGGSIGLWLSRLWKREVVCAHLPAGHETPWDSSPIIGISRRLGYLFLQPDRYFLTPLEIKVPKTVMHRSDDLVIVHRNDAERLLNVEF